MSEASAKKERILKSPPLAGRFGVLCAFKNRKFFLRSRKGGNEKRGIYDNM